MTNHDASFRPALCPRWRCILLFVLLCLATGTTQAALIFDVNSNWRFHRGTNEASLPDVTMWRTLNFDDSDWEIGPGPFSYGEGLVGGTPITDMQNRYSCIFFRRTFVITNAAEISAMRLGVLVEDGLVAWINTNEVRRINMPGTTNSPVSASGTFATAQAEPLPGVTGFDLPPPAGYLVNGTNILTIQAFNTSIGSTDFAFDAWLKTYVPDSVPPTISSVNPAPGAVTELDSITVTFSEPVNGLSADDFIVAGVRAFSMTGGDGVYTFGFPQPPYGPVSVIWSATHGITDDAFTPNPFDATGPGATWQYTLVDQTSPVLVDIFPAANTIVRGLTQIEVTFSEDVLGVNAGDLRINGQPATNLVVLSGSQFRFEFLQPPPGPATAAWVAGHGITDTATVPNPFAGGSWSYQFDPNAPVGDLVINEILASNQSGLVDEDGDQNDWIEIYNRGSFAVELSHWSLSDIPGLPGQWIFPQKTLGPGQYLIVFASGKDRRDASGTNRLHTNFRLSSGGEFLGLYSADLPRVLVSSFNPEYPEQRNDNSYGYDSNGDLRYFSTPTPGAPNGTSTIDGVASRVHFSSTRGNFNQPFTLILSCETPGVDIRYTTDGAEPTLSSRPYFGPVRLTNTTIVRAAAFRPDLLPSLPETHSFYFNLTAAQRSLPIFSISTAVSNMVGRSGIIGMGGGTRASDNLFITNNPATDFHNPSMHGIAWERPVSLEYIFADNSGFQVDCGLRVQGSDYQRPRTTPSSKFSFRTYFRGDYGPGRLEYPVFPMTTVESFDQLVLRAGFNENGNPFIRDELSRRLFHDLGQVSSHGGFANLFTNGFYAGFYNPCERIHEEWAQAYYGGSEDWDIISPSFATSSSGAGIVDGDRTDFHSLTNYIYSQSPTNPLVYQEIGRRLDLVNFVDYLLINVFSSMGDWPQNNFRGGRDRAPGGIWRFWVWDAEWGFGFNGRGFLRDTFAESGPGPNDSGLSTPASEIAQIYQRLRLSPEFRLLWADRIHKHLFNGGALLNENVTNRFNEMRNELLGVIPSMNTDILTYTAGRRPVVLGLFNTYGLYGYSNALYGIFASSNAPAFNQHGGRVVSGFSLSMTAPIPGSTIYYTLDGSDPRVMFTGAVSNSAAVYAAPIILNQTAVVRARSLVNGTNWSALAEAHFQVATLGVPLRITELNYNPVNPTHEFLELQNIGTAAVDLSRMTFDGITFTFQDNSVLEPGARLVLASNQDPTAFAARYPGVTVFGHYGGSLNNGGERISLKDEFGNLLLTVDYDNNNGWPVGADGGGYSLEMINPAGDSDDPANWKRSGVLGGTPGAVNSPNSPLPAVTLNEVMADNGGAVNNGGTFPDWIELRNSSGVPVNLLGWSLSDDGNLRKFIFPSVSIPANGYLVVWCDDTTNTTPGLHTGFALSRGGESIGLYDPATNRLDAVSFGLQLTNFTVGRIAGQWQLTDPTPNLANTASPIASPASLFVNEWLANPPAGQSDWIEVHNTSDSPAALQGWYLSNTSAVHQINSLSFIAPRGFVQLFADEAPGVDHLDFRLSATGGTIVLNDPTAAEINRVSYTNQTENVSRGRLPDGSATFANFPGTLSPGASNYVAGASSVLVINEVLARNQTAVTNAGRVADFVELFNPNSTNVPLAGFSLSVDESQIGQWRFPPTASIPANGYLVIWCDGGSDISTNAPNFNTGRSLDGESGGVYVFNAAGQTVSAIEYGFQVPDLAIGRVSGSWRLLASATPGAANSAAASLGSSTALRINEWMADPIDGPDWFELHNTTNAPVEMSNMVLVDDPSIAAQSGFRIAALSFVGPNGFVQWIADNDANQGRHHVDFSLNDQGETIRLYATNGTSVIDSITFAEQDLDVSEGRFPDGQSTIVSFIKNATPGESNFLPLPNVVINEILTHTDPPLEDAIELRNIGAVPVAVGGWFLSDAQDNFRKYRLADNTTIPPGGFLVVYQFQFSNATANSFTLNSSRGDEVWLSAADALGNLTGYRTGAKFGAAANGVSFGRIATSAGDDYASLTQRTFGADNPGTLAQFRTGTGLANAAPIIGPVVINEIMYEPADGPTTTSDDEFIELRNATASAVQLFDPAHATNTWRLTGGVEFKFPPNTTLAANAFLLVVPFSSTDFAAVTAFRSKYGVPGTVPVLGPYSGRLNNEGESIELVRPDVPQPLSAPDAGFVPQILVDRVNYSDRAPWPYGTVNGGGQSLQRRPGLVYGNEALNWVAALPTAGAANNAGGAAPVITASPQSQLVLEGTPPNLSVSATGAGPLQYQWRFNGTPIPRGTNAALVFDYVVLADEGDYDCVVNNPGGGAISAKARLTVTAPAVIIVDPVSITNRQGTNVSFSVAVKGSEPIQYQWRLNGITLPGETNSILLRTNIQFADDGEYDVVVSNPVSSDLSSAQLTVLINTSIVIPPVNITVVTGGVFTVSVTAFGNPLPLGYDWRQGSVPMSSNTVFSRVDYGTFVAPTNLVVNQLWRVVVRNLAYSGTLANSTFFVTTQLDVDADGIPDPWEESYGLNPGTAADRNADNDGDGASNYDEFRAGTNPTNAASRLELDLTGLGPNSSTLQFDAISNRTYTIQFTENLGTLEWSKLNDIPTSTNNRPVTVLDPTRGTNRFYRIATPRQ